MSNATWTDERVAMLRKLYGLLSASQIGERIGITRNAVIGKAMRLGLAGKVLKSAGAIEISPTPRPAPPPPKPKPARPARTQTVHLEPGIVDLPPDTSPFACTIDALTDVTCRWPLGNPAWDMTYCGAVTAGRAFCARHQSIAYYRPSKRHA